jgi:UDP-glucuronate 4-epimerase
MKILVTGAAGFIGCNLSKRLVKNGHDVLAIDNYSNYYSIELKEARVKNLLNPVGLQVRNIDICDENELSKLYKENNFEVVINLAAQAGVRLSLTEYDKYTQSNLNGFGNILRMNLIHEVPNFLYASSSSVYGDLASIPYTESEQNLSPNSFYGATKLANEVLAKGSTRNNKVKSRGLRLFTAYGPWGRPDMAYLRIINSALQEKEFSLFGDGSIERDFTFVDDVTRMVDKLMIDLVDKPYGFSDLVNLGGGKPSSMLELISTVEAILDTKIKIKNKPKFESDSKKTMADSRYLMRLLSDKPEIDLLTGVTTTINWAKENNIISKLDNWIHSTK